MNTRNFPQFSTGRYPTRLLGGFRQSEAGGLFYVAIFIHGALTGLTIILLAVLIGGAR